MTTGGFTSWWIEDEERMTWRWQGGELTVMMGRIDNHERQVDDDEENILVLVTVLHCDHDCDGHDCNVSWSWHDGAPLQSLWLQWCIHTENHIFSQNHFFDLVSRNQPIFKIWKFEIQRVENIVRWDTELTNYKMMPFHHMKSLGCI